MAAAAASCELAYDRVRHYMRYCRSDADDEAPGHDKHSAAAPLRLLYPPAPLGLRWRACRRREEGRGDGEALML